MIRALWNSRSGMQAMQDKLDSISNNIANSQTDGYKKVDVSFNDLVYEQLERTGYPTNKNGVNQHLTGSGVKSVEWARDDAQGSLKATGQSTDFAIDGKGFFKVTLPDGSLGYTRDGGFKLDSTGTLVDSQGDRLEVNYTGDKVALTEGKFIVKDDGTLVNTSGTSNVPVGKINLYEPIGQDSLISVGNNIFKPKTGVQLNTVTDSSIKQGFLEASNVDLSKEMTDMIVTQRAFELSSKSLSTVDQMMGIINALRSS